MEPLMRLVVPDLDGGLLTPLVETMSDNIGNFTARTDFEFQLDGPYQLLNLSHTEADGIALNATYGLNVSHVDYGKPLLLWYYGRLRSQIPLFATASLLWLLLLACLIGVHLHLRRSRSLQIARLRGYARSQQQKRLRSLFGLFTAILMVIVIGSVLAILHWSGRAQFSGMSDPTHADSNGTAPERNGSADRTQLMATFRRTIDEFDRFVELSIVETNATVLSVCNEELPNVLQVLETIATYLLDRLAEDFKLTPLLDSFDEFIDLVKLLVDSMRAVKDSRLDVVSPLAEFTTLLESVRRDMARQVSDACQNAGRIAAAPPADLCHRVSVDLARLAVGIDHRQLDSDSSVTIVTLLEKMLKLNFSQVEEQVGSAKSQLYGSLDLVKAEVKKLFDQLVVLVSTQFENALVDATDFRSNLRGAKRDHGFLVAMETIDRTVLGLSIALGIGSFVFLAILFLALFVSLRYMLSFRSAGGNSAQGDGTDEVDLVYMGAPGVSVKSPVSTKGASNGRTALARLLWDADALVLPSARQSARKPRDWHSTCLLLSCLLVLAALIYSAAVFYTGAEAHMDACRYLTTETGVAKVDQLVNRLIEDRLWPQIEALLDREVKIPLGISRDQIPRRLFGPVMEQCGNDSATIFQVLGLGSLINVSRVLRSPAVLSELAKGSGMIQGLVRDLNTSNLIPPEVDDLLHKTLPSFAAVIDAENFEPSIRELGKPLLLIGSGWPALRGDFAQLEASLLHANSSDRRAVLIRYFSDQAQSLIAQWNWTLSSRLESLLGHYSTLQTNRRLTNLTLGLTASAVALKGALSDKQLLLKSIRERYSETLERHMATVASLLAGIVHRLQSRVGKCRELRDIFQIPVGWCRSQIQPLSHTGFYMMASCLAFYILVHLLLTLMHLIMRQTGDRGALS